MVNVKTLKTIKKIKKKSIKKSFKKENIEIYKKRLEYFQSDDFLDKLLSKIPSNDGLPRKGKQGYSAFLSDLFNFKFETSEARHMLEPIPAQQQCLTALQQGTRGKLVDQVNTVWGAGNKYCYICGIKMGDIKGQTKMQCEHILSVVTGISHWWLLQSRKAKCFFK